MAALVFPPSPTPFQRYPANPGVSGSAQYEWNGSKGVWDVVPNFVRTNNQGAYNDYVWSNTTGGVGEQLTRVGTYGLDWGRATSTLVQLENYEPIDGLRTAFTLYERGIIAPYSPNPPSNVFVVVGGVPQEYETSYVIVGPVISFFEAPAAGSSFFAITAG